jgi:hypothetical protein
MEWRWKNSARNKIMITDSLVLNQMLKMSVSIYWPLEVIGYLHLHEFYVELKSGWGDLAGWMKHQIFSFYRVSQNREFRIQSVVGDHFSSPNMEIKKKSGLPPQRYIGLWTAFSSNAD